MPRLSTDDERRFRRIAQIHQDLIGAMWMNAKQKAMFHEAQELIDSIRVKGDAEREKRAADPDAG